MTNRLPIPVRPPCGVPQAGGEARLSGSWRARLPAPERQAEIAGQLALALGSEASRGPAGSLARDSDRARPCVVRQDGAQPAPCSNRSASDGHTPGRPRPSIAPPPAGEGPRRIAYVHPEIAHEGDLEPARGNGLHGPSSPASGAGAARVDAPAHEDEAPPAGERGGRTALRTTTPQEEEEDAGRAFAPQRWLLLRDARRAWMGPTFKRAPHTILLVSLRLARVPGANTPEAAALLRRTHKALGQALADLGPTYAITPFADGLLLSGHNLRQGERIAHAVGGAIADRSARHPQSPMLFAAGIAALHRDEDPTAALCLAEHCLRTAERSGESRVVAETDPVVRGTSRRAS